MKVANWVNRIRKMKHRGGPIQQWVDSIAMPTKPVDIQINCDDHSLTPPPTPEHSNDLMYSCNANMTINGAGSSANTMTSSLRYDLVPNLVAMWSKMTFFLDTCDIVTTLLEFF